MMLEGKSPDVFWLMKGGCFKAVGTGGFRVGRIWLHVGTEPMIKEREGKGRRRVGLGG